MIPNDFGIIRQADHNLFATLYPPFTDISESMYEIIEPEYVEGAYIAGPSGNIISSSAFCYAVIDVSKYDYILIPVMSLSSTTVYSGLTDQPTGSGSSFTETVSSRAISNQNQTAWGLIKCQPARPYAVINSKANHHFNAIGFKTNRSDHVNPLGIIQPLDPGLLRPQVEDPDVEEEALEESLGDVDPYPEDN